MSLYFLDKDFTDDFWYIVKRARNLWVNICQDNLRNYGDNRGHYQMKFPKSQEEFEEMRKKDIQELLDPLSEILLKIIQQQFPSGIAPTKEFIMFLLNVFDGSHNLPHFFFSRLKNSMLCSPILEEVIGILIKDSKEAAALIRDNYSSIIMEKITKAIREKGAH